LLRTYFDVMPVPVFDAEKDSLLTHLEVREAAAHFAGRIRSAPLQPLPSSPDVPLGGRRCVRARV
jgi:hypothetical protein